MSYVAVLYPQVRRADTRAAREGGEEESTASLSVHRRRSTRSWDTLIPLSTCRPFSPSRTSAKANKHRDGPCTDNDCILLRPPGTISKPSFLLSSPPFFERLTDGGYGIAVDRTYTWPWPAIQRCALYQGGMDITSRSKVTYAKFDLWSYLPARSLTTVSKRNHLSAGHITVRAEDRFRCYDISPLRREIRTRAFTLGRPKL